MTNKEIETQAVGIVQREVKAWADATAFITEKVAFQMRNLIRQCRKNYWGIFDEPNDPVTGRPKIWPPLTESQVEAVVKNIDLDTKDINFVAKKPSAIAVTAVIRNIVKNELDDIGFGEKLDDLERRLAIDGTAVWKTAPDKDEDGSHHIKVTPVDLLNVYIDPTAESIAKAYRFTERSLMTIEEIKKEKGWLNTEGMTTASASPNLSRTDDLLNGSIATVSNTNKYKDVYELWGWIPKSLITGEEEDKDIEVEGHIIVSGIDSKDTRCHLVEENKEKRPYEEAWYTRVPGRWYGKGIAEKLLMLQLWMNTIVNIRINRSYVSQLGIFKIKKGAGITPQMLSRLAANGAVQVNTMDDIQQMVVQEASQASYQDESVIQGWAQKVTSAFDVVVGESMPASTSATATSLSAQGAQSSFSLVKEGIGMFIERWLENQAIPIIMKNITRGDIYKITGEIEELFALDEMVVNKIIADRIDLASAAGLQAYQSEEQMLAERDSELQKLRSTGRNRYIKLLHDIDPSDFDTDVVITNEDINKGVISQNILQSMQLAPEYRDSLIRQLFDVMGLDSIQLKKVQAEKQTPNKVSTTISFKDLPMSAQQELGKMIGLPIQSQGMSPQEGLMKAPTQNPQQIVTRANTPQR